MALTSMQQLSLDSLTFTGFAVETVSGGQFMTSKSSTDVVDTTGLASSFVDNELLVGRMDASTDDEFVVGVALETVTSGLPVAVATRGIYIMGTQGAITTGGSVSPSSATDAFCNSVIATADGEEEFKIGRALTGASASGKFILVALNV